MSKNPWGDKPIKNMTQAEFEQRHRDNAHAEALVENAQRERAEANRRLIREDGQI